MRFLFQRENLPFEKLGKSYFVVDEQNGVYAKLENTETVIWESLEKPRSLLELSKIICSKYQIDQETAKKDLQEFLNQAIKKGFVKRIEK